MTDTAVQGSPPPADETRARWPAHHVLRDEPGAPLVVLTDFAAAGRPTAQFPALVPLLATRAAYWETAPPPFGREAGMTGDDHGTRWLADVQADGRPVAAVLGFCSGSVYAGWLADRLARVQDPPAVILLDPEPAYKRMVLEDFEKLVTSRMGSLLTPEESGEALETARRADRETGDDALALAERLVPMCRGVVRAGYVRLSGTEHRCDEFIALFVGYLRWLAAACAVSDFRGWQGAHVLLSSTPEIGLVASPEHVRTQVVGAVHDLDVPHFDLLRSPGTARRIDSILGGGAA